ncbi:hypothetical protein NLJ89_g3054 [Agrocybe chaxingu]|uniref:Nephrocystin 3-like N-terminal domain-containing protein n=1 Tax=Agrocybe chaxingu TaxID=84603 RepID=A0A9W8MYM6_9AGAR|nr:hypothetical protein NLJ89_g3054 [Agrocybe chaxingu]
MFANSTNTLVTGGTFIHSEGDTNLVFGQHDLDRSQTTIAPGAMHNSGERFDPPKCHPNTRVAIIEEIMQWSCNVDREQLMLWLNGPAGAGKSSIAQKIAELCFEHGLLLASFFFSRVSAGRNTESRLADTIAYQLSLNIPLVRPQIVRATERDPNFFRLSLEAKTKMLITEPLNNAFKSVTDLKSLPWPHLVITDGLDECYGIEAQRRILDTVITAIKGTKFPLIFLIASRPEVHISTHLGREPFRSNLRELVLDKRYQPHLDIKLYLQDALSMIHREHPFREHMPTDWPFPQLVDMIVRKSSGQFIYAATVVKYVDSVYHRPDERLASILGLQPLDDGSEDPFAELDALYTHIFSGVDNIKAALRILGLVILSEGSQSPVTTPIAIEGILLMRQGSVQVHLSKLAWPTRSNFELYRVTDVKPVSLLALVTLEDPHQAIYPYDGSLHSAEVMVHAPLLVFSNAFSSAEITPIDFVLGLSRCPDAGIFLDQSGLDIRHLLTPAAHFERVYVTQIRFVFQDFFKPADHVYSQLGRAFVEYAYTAQTLWTTVTDEDNVRLHPDLTLSHKWGYRENAILDLKQQGYRLTLAYLPGILDRASCDEGLITDLKVKRIKCPAPDLQYLEDEAKAAISLYLKKHDLPKLPVKNSRKQEARRILGRMLNRFRSKSAEPITPSPS